MVKPFHVPDINIPVLDEMPWMANPTWYRFWEALEQSLSTTDGQDGNGVLSGSGAPSADLGNTGDFYIDVSVWVIYGPKTLAWGFGTSLIGASGSGAGVMTESIVAYEDLTAGSFVNMFNNSGVSSVRLAQVVDDAKMADGFVKGTVSAGDSADMWFLGQLNDAVTGMVGGDIQWLAENGGITSIIPSSGWRQMLGKAADTSRLVTFAYPGVLL